MVLEEVRGFVQTHPREVIIIKLETYLQKRTSKNHADRMKNLDEAVVRFDQVIQDSGLGAYVKQIDSWPTLGELRSEKKTVILLGTTGPIIKKSKYLSNSRLLVSQVHWEAAKKADCTLYSKAREGGLIQIGIGPEMSFVKNSFAGKALSAMNAIINVTKKKKNKSALQVSNVEIDSYDYSKVNSRKSVEAELNKCKARHTFTGFIVSGDHVHKGQMKAVVDEHNRSLQ